MRIAVAYENGEVFQHFGHTEHFKLYEVKGGAVLTSMVIEAIGCGHEALADFLGSMRVSTLICGGIGGGARAALEEAGIVLYGGVTGSADDAVQALLAGTLQFDPDIHCHQHDGETGHACAHACGEHTCSEQTCAEHHCSHAHHTS